MNDGSSTSMLKLLSAIKEKNKQYRRRDINIHALGFDSYQFNQVFREAKLRGFVEGGKFQDVKGTLYHFTADMELTPKGEYYLEANT
ncbi:YjcQ family protein [Exiguobacterium sp. s192]|uniref:YjcQ family protein n=1 Tax=Exiguobacterium sp. s192 TaxID=2751206 RepID=UPI001BE8A37E|nr:YjcQ family protein [Exiguobacterium sp. s192]